MSSIPWSAKPQINPLSLTDIFMRGTPSQAIKNQEILFSDVQSFLQGASVKLIASEADLPITTNGFHQLEPLTSYKFTQQNIVIATPILLPAGYVGHLENLFSDASGVVYIGTPGTSFIQTLNLEGTIDSVVDAGGGNIRVTTSSAHGLVVDQFVNIRNSTVSDYDEDRQKILAVTSSTEFDVADTFIGTATGNWDTGYQSLQFRNFVSATNSPLNKVLDITSTGDPNTNMGFLNAAFFGYASMGIIRKGIGVFSDILLSTMFGETWTIEDGNITTISNTRFEEFNPGAINPAITFTGSGTTQVGVTDTSFILLNSAQTAIRVDSSVNNAKFVRIQNAPDNDVADNYFDTSGGGLDETNPQVIANENGVRKNSMTVGEAIPSRPLIIGGIDGFQPLIDTLTPANGDWVEDINTERFSVDLDTGIMTYTGLKPVVVKVSYSFDIISEGGPATQNVNTELRIGGTSQAKTLQSWITPSVVVYNGNFLLNPGNTLQIFLDHVGSTDDTGVRNAIFIANL